MIRRLDSKPCCKAQQLLRGYDRLRLPQPHVHANRRNKASPFMTGPFVPVRILNPIRAVVGIPHHRFNLFVKCSSLAAGVRGCYQPQPFMRNWNIAMADPKSNKLKARLPRGLADRAPAEIAATQRMMETIRKVYELYGFEPVETPAIEYTDALGKFLPDQDRPNEGVFSFQDDDEQWLSLRYDLTAPLARYVAENFDTLPKPYRSYRAGYVYRNEKPGPGRLRQFMQFDADTVGSASMAADAELCMMAADTMDALGLKAHYAVRVNNRKLLDGLLESIDLGGGRKASRRLTALCTLAYSH